MGAPGGTVEIELELPARPEVIAIARSVLITIARDHARFDEMRIADVRLAVSEACTNAVEAQIERGTPGPIRVRCRVGVDRMWIAVRDRGGGFDPDAVVRSTDLTVPSRLDHEGGLGIPLIRLLADEVEFHGVDDGTEVSMVFGPRVATGRIGP